MMNSGISIREQLRVLPSPKAILKLIQKIDAVAFSLKNRRRELPIVMVGIGNCEAKSSLEVDNVLALFVWTITSKQSRMVYSKSKESKLV